MSAQAVSQRSTAGKVPFMAGDVPTPGPDRSLEVGAR
jgi:hypothetical protein